MRTADAFAYLKRAVHAPADTEPQVGMPKSKGYIDQGCCHQAPCTHLRISAPDTFNHVHVLEQVHALQVHILPDIATRYPCKLQV